ncbi:short-chain dehydrogenase/reductase-like protein SDR [Aaosphaeria arxii CBS 175.79]|uniref:Short-chain dehydrogenase/reductase-like protein SDR n=1 Tax=Aaosphaeria arxii CBS 175.79 TaxID=1450172 RepID=A0A6A5XYN4_9PLEO|nr:short-chain dehydrogenase/reductase-like protein SDR [Aaosphaeria arxii CBS 175.79]KAF2017927.1 short-chain dehydrogenase/reductase-like protein SDR [Aaosphaeria arxii CBS 175.79]
MASTMDQLTGVAAITGAGGTGIGAAVAQGFARSGCTRIAITDINPDSLNATKNAILKINPDVEVFLKHGDVADEGFVDSFFDSVFENFSRLDYAVNCAGILGGDMIKAVEMTMDQFDRLNNINYRGSWLCCRAQLRNMLKQEPLPESAVQRGSIVNIASQLGIVARPGAAAYCASKAAIINMTRSNAIDYSDKGIRVNCVCPGVIETPMTSSTPEIVEALRPAIDIAPMKRMGKPDEVANAVLFLCSSKSSFVQGHALVVDGGYTIN